MSVTEFLISLVETGQAIVPSELDLPANESRSIESTIAAFEPHHRRTLPPDPPALHVESATWAAEKLYRACQVITCRDIDAGTATSLIASENSPDPSNPSHHYSIDLVFRFLPDVVKQAKNAGEQDPILDTLRQWCQTWPLSSVGVEDLGPVDAKTILAHPCLATIYINRIFERRDIGRTKDSAIQSKLRSIAGGYPELVKDWMVKLD